MPKQFFSRLSQNYIEILDDEEYYDIIIEVGKDPNVKIFRAHMIILCYRSPFLRQTLISSRNNNDGIVAHIKLPNVSSEIFQIILKYIYGGIISLNEQDPSEILKVLIASNELLLQELVDYIQEYLIENKADWIEQHFALTHRTSFHSNSFLGLQKYCTDFMDKFPEKIFRSLDYTSLSETSLISIIKRDDLQMKEIEIWEHVLKWGLEKNPTLLPDPITWSDYDFRIMENTLKNCLPLVRFFSLSSKDFSRKVHPYKRLLKHKLYEELLGSYLVSNIEPSNNILLPRYKNINRIINSKIVNLNIVSIISRWIGKIDINNKYAYARELYLPYEFKLLLRGSRDGFTPRKFHELCDNIPHTVTFIKIKGTEEIVGGYNPLIWMSHSTGQCGKTKDSFIFSFKNKDDLRDLILSHVKNMDKAIYYKNSFGPTFYDDLDLYVMKGGIEPREDREYNYSSCKQKSYEKKIRDTERKFSIEDYEVYQIVNDHAFS